MAIHNETQVEIAGGFDKQIEKSAMGMMLDVLQRFQYQYPIKSVIRELVSNSLDAIKERQIAISILTEKNIVSDYFVTKEGAMYQDSQFDPSYYDLQWLTQDSLKNKVTIVYIEGKSTEKDYLQIIDNGIGLGNQRLEKYFSLGYSTKRLSKSAIGKFGIGNKSPLAIMPYYTVESRYNGKLFRFNVYNSKVESLIPPQTFTQKNHKYTLENGYELFYEDTCEPNGVTITIEAKKHHRQQYIDAVKSQLLYFSDVKMIIQQEDGHKTTVNHQANIFYEDDGIILSDNSYWAKPHILINRVNYGFVNFEELELEQKQGNIGIKVNPEEVSINPSREALVWDDTTKEAVLSKFRAVVETATKFVQEELQETNFVKWMRICYQLSSKYQAKGGTTNVINRLANIIDLTQVKPNFPGNNQIRFHPTNLLAGVECRLVQQVIITEAGKKKNKVDRAELPYGIGPYSQLPIVLINDRASNRKDRYLLTLYTSGFIMISMPTNPVYNVTTTLEKQLEIEENGNTIWKYLNESALDTTAQVFNYDDIEIPETFVGTDADEEDLLTLEEKKQLEVSKTTRAERRKLEGKTVVHTPRTNTLSTLVTSKSLYTWQKVEIPIKSINGWKEEEIFWGNDADNDSLLLAALLSRNPTEHICDVVRKQTHISTWRNALADMPGMKEINQYDAYRCTMFFDNPSIKIVKVAQNNTKYYTDFKHIRQFFLDFQNNTITMSNILVKWNTARQIQEKLHKLDFLYNFPFDERRSTEYHNLCTYVKHNYKEIYKYLDKEARLTSAAYNDLLTHLDKVQMFQLFVKDCTDSTEIANVAKEMWGNDKIINANALDLEVWIKFTELLEWAEPITKLLNSMPTLTGLNNISRNIYDPFDDRNIETIENDLGQEIQSYLEWKGVLTPVNS